MSTKEKFTFKKQPKATGLASIGSPNPSTDIKHKGLYVGYIAGPDWRSNDDKWRIRLMVTSDVDANFPWHWVTLKANFDLEPDARVYLNGRVESILGLNLYHNEDIV